MGKLKKEVHHSHPNTYAIIRVFQEIQASNEINRIQRQAGIAEGIEIDMPSGSDSKEVTIVYRAHGGMAFERLFRSDDSLKEYTGNDTLTGYGDVLFA